MEPSRLLTGTRVRLTAFADGDLSTFASWEQDESFARFFDTRPAAPRTESQLQEHVRSMHESKNDFLFAVRPLESEDLVGYLEIDGIDWVHRVGGMGLGIAPAHWDEGFGTEAGELGLRFAFRELNLHRINVTVFSYNERSLALVGKLGFVQEGVLRERLERDGRRFDMLMFGLLRSEWTARGPIE